MKSKENRTLTALRNLLPGKIYLYYADHKTALQLVDDAREQGYKFGGLEPSDDHADNLVALKGNKQLSHVGFVGRMAFQCNGGSNAEGFFHRIDYAKYRSGDQQNIYIPSNRKEDLSAEAQSRFHGPIHIVENQCERAAEFARIRCNSVKDYDAEYELFKLLENKYGVSIYFVE